MIDDQFSPNEQRLIERIQATPRLQISPTARETIRERMLTEFRALPPASALTPSQIPIGLVAAAVVIVVVIVIVLIALSQAQPPRFSQPPVETMSGVLSPTPPLTASVAFTQTPTEPLATETPLMPTASPMLTDEAALPTASDVPTVSFTQPATVTPTATSITPTMTLTVSPTAVSLGTTIVIEGPVLSIVNNIITIYDFEIAVEPNHPILNLIAVGDPVRVEGTFGEENIVAAVISPVSETPLANGATISLDGPVESMNGSTIVVNGIVVQLATGDPLLQTLSVGQRVRVQGNFQNNGTTFVLVVVNIVTINTSTGGGTTGSSSGGGDKDCGNDKGGNNSSRCRDKSSKKS